MKLEKKQTYKKYIMMALLCLCFAFVCSLNTGKYPLQLWDILQGEEAALNVFWTLRFPRSCMAIIAGFGLGIVGMIYQTVFQNPLASPDIIGVSSGACAGAAFAILFISNSRMRGNKQAYPEFIQDTFNLYDTRSQGSHYKKVVNYGYDDEDIEKLFKITRVFIELI